MCIRIARNSINSEVQLEEDQSLNEWLVCLSGKHSHEDGKSSFTPIVEETSKLKTIGDLKALTKGSS